MTIPLTALGFGGGVAYFGSLEMDPTKPIFVRRTIPESRMYLTKSCRMLTQ